MYSNHVLRRQVRTELKKRRYILYTLLLLSILYVGANLIFGDAGLLRQRELKKTEALVRSELERTNERNAKLKTAIESYKKDDFYFEKHAREEFGLAGPDEYIYIYK